MAVPALLEELLRAPGPSGHEGAVAAVVRREAAAFGAEVSGDVLGSTVARVRGTGAGRMLAVFAHADSIGMSVSHVFDDGLLGVTRLAKWGAGDAAGQRVEVLAAAGRVPGVAVRVGDGEVTWNDVRLDVGAGDRDEAAALVQVGDPVVLMAPPVALRGSRVASASLDDRAGLYAALEALRRLAADPPAWDVALVASTQEEGAGDGGARAAAVRLRPDAALVVEATFATGAAGHDPVEWGAHDLGDGAVIFRGPVVSPVVVDALVRAAEHESVPHCFETGESTWSDADAVFAAAEGIATGMVSIPLRSMHTANEVVDVADVETVSRLVEAFARGLDDDASFGR
jgi:endoglucanase